MKIIDQFAYGNAIRSVDPAYKVGLVALVVLLCLWFDKPLVGLLAIAWMFVLTVIVARIPARIVRRTLLAQALFLALSTVAILLSFSLNPPAPTELQRWAFPLGPLWISTSAASLDQAARIITRALGSAAAMNFLALTTPMVDLVDLLRRLRLPQIFIDLMTLMYRSIFLLLGTLNRMVVAQESRLGYATLRRGYASAGMLGSQLFIDAYRSGRRLQLGMESRGFTGELRVLPSQYRRDNRWFWIVPAVAITLCLASAIA